MVYCIPQNIVYVTELSTIFDFISELSSCNLLWYLLSHLPPSPLLHFLFLPRRDNCIIQFISVLNPRLQQIITHNLLLQAFELLHVPISVDEAAVQESCALAREVQRRSCGEVYYIHSK